MNQTHMVNDLYHFILNSLRIILKYYKEQILILKII